jgi:hypothetical protein
MTYEATLPEIGAKTTGISGFLGNLGIFWELTWDFYKITVGNAENISLCISRYLMTLYYIIKIKMCIKGKS